ncbi:MAG: Regulatory protein RecX [Pseudomonadota bacterium]|jgi:regulatory protein
MNRPAFEPSLKGRALRLLSQREHSRLELERKLAQHETDPGELAKALDELQARGFISEERVVESVIHRRASKLGTARVKQELQSKGLSAAVMAEALEQLRSTELERAREVWARKFGTPATEPKEKARQIRFLVSRGFAAEVVRKVVG